MGARLCVEIQARMEQRRQRRAQQRRRRHGDTSPSSGQQQQQQHPRENRNSGHGAADTSPLRQSNSDSDLHPLSTVTYSPEVLHRRRQRRHLDGVPDEFLRPSRALYPTCPWPDEVVSVAILARIIGPCYPPLQELPAAADATPPPSEPSSAGEECGVCMQRYEFGLNRCVVCRAGVCTECYLQMCKAPVGRRVPRERERFIVHAIAMAKCPFCNTKPYKVKFRALTKQERAVQDEESAKVATLEKVIQERRHNYEDHVARHLEFMEEQRASATVSPSTRLACCEWVCGHCSLANSGTATTCAVCGNPAPPTPSYDPTVYTFMMPDNTYDIATYACRDHHNPASLQAVLRCALVEAVPITDLAAYQSFTLRLWRLGSVDVPVTLPPTGPLTPLQQADPSSVRVLDMVWSSDAWAAAPPRSGHAASVLVQIDDRYCLWPLGATLRECGASVMGLALGDVLATAMDRAPHLVPCVPVACDVTAAELQVRHGDVFTVVSPLELDEVTVAIEDN